METEYSSCALWLQYCGVHVPPEHVFFKARGAIAYYVILHFMTLLMQTRTGSRLGSRYITFVCVCVSLLALWKEIKALKKKKKERKADFEI